MLTTDQLVAMARKKGIMLTESSVYHRILKGWTLDEIINTRQFQRRKSKRTVYVVYKNDEYLMEGTAEEISKATGLTIGSIYSYVYRRRKGLHKTNYEIFEVDEE